MGFVLFSWRPCTGLMSVIKVISISQDYHLRHINNFPSSSGQPWVEKIKVFFKFILSFLVLIGNQLHLGLSIRLIFLSVGARSHPQRQRPGSLCADLCLRTTKAPLPNRHPGARSHPQWQRPGSVCVDLCLRTTKAHVCRLAIQALRPVAVQLESGNCLRCGI